MRIVDVTVWKVDASWRNWVFVRVETDSGLVGYGECTVEGREHAVEGAVKDMARRLTGRDPRRIRDCFDLLTRRGYWDSGPVVSSAAGGIEMALWDILGKSLDAPVHALLGGRIRDSAPVYSNAWYFGARTADDFAERAVQTVGLGYGALKFDPFGSAGLTISEQELAAALERVAAVREAVGPGVGLLIEGHGRFGLQSAVRVGRALEPFDPLFFEEPLPAGNFAALRRVAELVRVPIAAGERCYSARECRLAIASGAVAVLQPDVIHVGGIGALHAVAADADAALVSLAPHNASGPIATAATLQVSALAPTLLLQEMFAPLDAPWRDLVARPVVEVEGGAVVIPDGPGLGVELDESELAKHPFIARDLKLLEEESILDRPVLPDGRAAGDLAE
ncbi:MAG TPA: mandelate racemase/muconate lactonizing enzyme family protein [Gaiellaceae bacterium]|nr:mandelate racemase/muconate lactonizing enzyme family protein [Gaiellaceae bacterium]